MAGWIKMPLGREVSLSHSDIVLDGCPAPPSPKGGRTPNFRSMSIVAKQLEPGWIKIALGMEVGLGPGHIVLDGDLAPLPKKGGAAPNFPPISVVAKLLDASRCHFVWR